MVAQATLTRLVMVRIHAWQPVGENQEPAFRLDRSFFRFSCDCLHG